MSLQLLQLRNNDVSFEDFPNFFPWEGGLDLLVSLWDDMLAVVVFVLESNCTCSMGLIFETWEILLTTSFSSHNVNLLYTSFYFAVSPSRCHTLLCCITSSTLSCMRLQYLPFCVRNLTEAGAFNPQLWSSCCISQDRRNFFWDGVGFPH